MSELWEFLHLSSLTSLFREWFSAFNHALLVFSLTNLKPTIRKIDAKNCSLERTEEDPSRPSGSLGANMFVCILLFNLMP